MADNIVESKGIRYPQDFSLNSLMLLTATGESIELKKLLVDFSYYEDIYTFVMSGHVTLLDAYGYSELLNLSGNEFLSIDFNKTDNPDNSLKRTFRVYKSGPRIPSGNQNGEIFTLYFCSEELLLSEQSKVSKAYIGQTIYDIITDILIDTGPNGKLKINSRKIEMLEETLGTYNFVVPKIKPFEAISWLSNYARPKILGTTGGADMLFFETKNGFNFRSLQSMFKDDAYTDYTYSADNLNSNKQSLKDKISNVIDYEITKPYDLLNEIDSGTFANRLITIDPTTKSYRVTDFNYLNYKNQSKTLNKESPTGSSVNRLKNSIFESSEGTLKLAFSNANQVDVPYIKQQAGATKDIYIENYIPNRTAQISLANYTTIKIVVPGDPAVTAGKTVNFNLLTLKPSLGKKELDKHYSGKYLVSAVRHIISPAGSYQTILELSKDSSPTNYPQITLNSTEWKKAVNK